MTDHRFVEINGLRLHMLDYGGDGRPIVCLHGVTGHAWMWHDVAPALTHLGRVVAVDMRGHGDSQWSRDLAYETSDHVADVRGLLDMIGTRPVDLVGLSWGGLVAMSVAAADPAAVRKLAIVDVPPSFGQAPEDVPPRPATFQTHAEAVGWERQANPNAADAMIEVMAAYGTRPAEGGTLGRKHDPSFLSRWPFRAGDHWDEWRSLEMPTLLVHGEKSFVLSADVAQQMVESLPGVTFARAPDAGHLVPVENPAFLAKVLAEFLAS